MKWHGEREEIARMNSVRFAERSSFCVRRARRERLELEQKKPVALSLSRRMTPDSCDIMKAKNIGESSLIDFLLSTFQKENCASM